MDAKGPREDDIPESSVNPDMVAIIQIEMGACKGGEDLGRSER